MPNVSSWDHGPGFLYGQGMMRCMRDRVQYRDQVHLVRAPRLSGQEIALVLSNVSSAEFPHKTEA